MAVEWTMILYLSMAMDTMVSEDMNTATQGKVFTILHMRTRKYNHCHTGHDTKWKYCFRLQKHNLCQYRNEVEKEQLLKSTNMFFPEFAPIKFNLVWTSQGVILSKEFCIICL